VENPEFFLGTFWIFYAEDGKVAKFNLTRYHILSLVSRFVCPNDQFGFAAVLHWNLFKAGCPAKHHFSNVRNYKHNKWSFVVCQPIIICKIPSVCNTNINSVSLAGGHLFVIIKGSDLQIAVEGYRCSAPVLYR
jgi:hypothetical protein